MVNPARPQDIVDRWRPLTGDEASVALAHLEDAWTKLLLVAPGLEQRLANGTTPKAAAISSLCSAVIRKMRNPEGHRQESRSVDDATRSWTLDGAVSTGELYFTAEELRQVMPVVLDYSGVFSVPYC